MSDEDNGDTFIELDQTDDLSTLSIDSIFGIKSNNNIYYIQFRKNEVPSSDYMFFLKICDELEDDDDDELLTWTFISLDHFSLIQHLIHTLQSITEQIAHYFFAISDDENCELFTSSEVNSFLLILSDAAEAGYSESFISSVFQVNKDFLDIVRAFDNLEITYDDLIFFFTKSQIVLDACRIYVDFSYYELFHLERFNILSDQLVANLTRAIEHTNADEESLKTLFVKRFALLSQ